jgi:hypothetical protein
MKKKLTTSISSLIIMSLLGQCAPVFVQTSTPPGQAKKESNTQSAEAFAPGQQKKAAGTQSAKEFAPGQQKKTASSQKPVPPGQAKKKQ